MPTALYDIAPCDTPKTFEDWKAEKLPILSLEKIHVALHHPGPKMQIEAQLHNLQVAVKDGGFLKLPLLNVEAYLLNGPRYKGLRPLYAWNLDGHVGQLQGALSLETAAQLVHFLQCFSFHAGDLDNFFPPPPSEATPIVKATEAATKRRSNFLTRAFGGGAHEPPTPVPAEASTEGSQSPARLVGEWPLYTALPQALLQHRASGESQSEHRIRTGSLDSSTAKALEEKREAAARAASRLSSPDIPRVLSQVSTASGSILIHESVAVADEKPANAEGAAVPSRDPSPHRPVSPSPGADSQRSHGGRQRALTAAPGFRVWSSPQLSPGRRRRAKTTATSSAPPPATEEPQPPASAASRPRLRLSRRSPKLPKAELKPAPLTSTESSSEPQRIGYSDFDEDAGDDDELEELAPNFVFGTLDIELESIDVILSVDSATAARVVVCRDQHWWPRGGRGDGKNGAFELCT